MSEPKEGVPPTLSEVRHALRTPLNQIIGYSQMLQEDATDQGQEDFLPDLEKIEKASRNLVALIDEYLAEGSSTTPTSLAPPSAPAPTAPPSETAAAEPEYSPRVVDGLRQLDDSAEETPSHLLVVDDDAMNRDMLARRLKRKGFEVSIACDGHEALALVGKKSFHLILLDVMMPGISGLDVLRELRQTYSVADLPIIMATAMDASEDVVQALRDGANDYVTKPLDFQVVLARVETQLALKRAKDRVEQLASELEVRNRFIRKTFGRFLSDEVVAQLLESPEGLRLGGEKRRVTILMSDLRGFTSTGDRLTPEQLVGILNNHLGRMANIIMSYGGTVDEFIGDSVLALFGAPVSRPDDAERAVACAVAMQREVAQINLEHRQQGLPELDMAVAINTGDVVVGNIGSDKRMKYGVVGSHVNLTSRIEGLAVGGQVLISEPTLTEAGSDVLTGSRVDFRAKGFREPIAAFEVKGIGGKHDLQVPEREAPLVSLPQSVAIQYSVLDGKAINAAVHEGQLIELSAYGCIVEATVRPDLLTNLSMRVKNPSGPPFDGDVYAKVVAGEVEGGFSLTFTSVPPDIKRFFKGLLEAV